MTLAALIRKASDWYPDGLLLACFDEDRGCPKENPEAGDTLAVFIVRELAETFDPEASDRRQLEAASRALETARRELERLESLLTYESRTARA